MNIQERMTDRRAFWIAAIAVATVAVLVVAAYLFGTRLRADTSATVAGSSEESSAAAVRKVGEVAPSILGANYTDTRGARTIVAAERAASAAALAKSRSDFYSDLNAAAEAARWALVAANDANYTVFYNALNATNAAADPYNNEWMGFIAPESVQVKALAAASPASSAAASQFADRYDRMNSPSAAGLSVPANFHDSSADFYGKPSTSAAADPYNNEWMGFTLPESVPIRSSVAPASVPDPLTSIKPEGIDPSAAVDSTVKQSPWIKPEGVVPPAAK